MTSARIGEEERAEAYLDGELTRDESAAFEQDLALRPEVAEALAAALALRELLVSLPPVAPPAGLADRIARALPLRRRAPGTRRRRAPSLAAARRPGRDGLDLPRHRRGGAGHGRPGHLRLMGMAQVRWALGPLGAPSEPAPRPPRPLWRRLLFRKKGTA